MSAFSPRSYIAEAVAASRSTSAPKTFVPSYYDFATRALRKKEKSELLAASLKDVYSKYHQMSGQILNTQVTLYCREVIGEISRRFQEALQKVETEVLRRVEKLSKEIVVTLECFGKEMQASSSLDEKLIAVDISLAAIAECTCEQLSGEEDLLLQVGGWLVAFPGEPWTVGVRGVGHDADGDTDVFIGQETLGTTCDARAMLRVQLSDQFERGVSVCASFLGERISHLLCIGILAKQCVDYPSLLTLLRTVASAPSTVTSFYCDGNDGFDMSLGMVLDGSESDPHSANIWNMEQYFLETVRAGNTADAAHLLQTKHNRGLFASCKELMKRLPRIKATFTIRTDDQRADIAETFDSFNFLNVHCDSGCVSVPQYSPLFNYMLNPGQVVNTCFAGEVMDGALTVRRVEDAADNAASANSSRTAFHFTVKYACLIGDCALVLGSVTAAQLSQARIPVHLPADSMYWMDIGFVTSPFVATFKHRMFGRVGFSGYGVASGSHFPPSLALIAPYHYAEFPLQEGAVDPNVTVHFYSGDSPGPLRNKSFKDLYNSLPVQLSNKSALDGEHLAVIIKSRLLRIIPHQQGEAVIVLVAVSDISFLSQTVFLHYQQPC